MLQRLHFKSYLLFLLVFFVHSIRPSNSTLADLQQPAAQVGQTLAFGKCLDLALTHVGQAAIAYVMVFVSTFMHELGHAVALRCFFGLPIHINAGMTGEQSQYRVPLFKMKYISLWSFDPTAGFVGGLPYDASPLKKMVINMAGPVVGVVSDIVFWNLKELFKADSFLIMLTIWFNYINNIANLIPDSDTSSDGYKALNNFMKLLSIHDKIDIGKLILFTEPLGWLFAGDQIATVLQSLEINEIKIMYPLYSANRLAVLAPLYCVLIAAKLAV